MTLSSLVASICAVASILLSLAAVASCRRALPPPLPPAGPYRSPATPAEWLTPRAGTARRLASLGTAVLTLATAPVLASALLTLPWENIGVTLVVAMVLTCTRLYGAVGLRGSDASASARVIAHASLLFDVPVGVFAAVHLRFVDDGLHHTMSLASVAAVFALVDGVQAALLLFALPQTRLEPKTSRVR